MKLKVLVSCVAMFLSQASFAQNNYYYHAPVPKPDFGVSDEVFVDFVKSKKIQSLKVDFGKYKSGKSKDLGSNHYTFNQMGFITDLAKYDKKQRLTYAQHLILDDENRAIAVFQTNRKGDTTSRTFTQYSDSGRLLDHKYLNKKGKVKYGQHYDYQANKLVEHHYIRNGKIYSTYKYEYYPNGDPKKTTSYNRRGKEKYVWRYECKDEGIEVKKHKDTSTVCIEKSADPTGNTKEVHLSTDEKGRILTTVLVSNPSGKVIDYKRMEGVDNILTYRTRHEYVADTVLLSYSYESHRNKRDYEGNVEYNRQGQVVLRNYKQMKKGKLKTNTKVTFKFAEDGLAVKKESITMDNQIYFSHFDYVRY